MGDLNAMVGVGNSGVEYVEGRSFCGFLSISAVPTIWLFAEQHSSTVRVIVSWQHPSGRHANQIDHLAISRRFRSCLEDIRNRKAADISKLRDHYLIIAMLRLRTAAIKQPYEMNHRAPTYLSRSVKSAETVALFNQSVDTQI